MGRNKKIETETENDGLVEVMITTNSVRMGYPDFGTKGDDDVVFKKGDRVRVSPDFAKKLVEWKDAKKISESTIEDELRIEQLETDKAELEEMNKAAMDQLEALKAEIEALKKEAKK